MDNNNVIIEMLKGIECPVDEVISRVIGVLEDYEVDGAYEIIAQEDNDFIHDGIRTYTAFSDSPDAPSVEVVVKEGLDHYVAKIIDANIIEE